MEDKSIQEEYDDFTQNVNQFDLNRRKESLTSLLLNKCSNLTICEIEVLFEQVMKSIKNETVFKVGRR